jgi:ABC-2 type transport system ATP-binding protein
VCTRSLQVREQVGYLPEQVPLYPELRVREHLGFRAALKGVPRRQRGGEIDRVTNLAGREDVVETTVGELSRGFRQRVGIADALLGEPPLLVLDEPTVGLDPNQVQQMRAMLRGLGGTQTLILSSHILAEIEVLCDRVVVLSHGSVVADESVEEALQAGRIMATWEADKERVEEVIAAAYRDVAAADLPDEVTIAQDAQRVAAEIPCREGRDPQALLEALGRHSARAQLTVVRLEVGRRRLEERFARVTGAHRVDTEEGA